MPKPERHPDSPIASRALAALMRLASRGAYAEPDAIGPEAPVRSFVISAPYAEGSEAPAPISAEVVSWALSRGWIAAEPGTQRYRIAAAGIAVLRRAKCSQSAAASQTRSQPREAVRTPRGGRGHARTVPEGSLAWLRRRKDKDGQPLITEPQFAAGERLAADFYYAQLMPRVTANWSGAIPGRRMRRSAPGAGIDLSNSVVAARQRIDRALAAVGPELAGMLVDVCCLEIGLEAAEQAHRLPPRAGKVLLQLALTYLARHYGLLAPAPTGAAHRLRHWGDADYRPSLDGWR
jgi:hypothetical protein